MNWVFLVLRSLILKQTETLYEHYASSTIKTGLSDKNPQFLLNGKPIQIFSGSIHYFRVHPAYWKDRLHKAKALGLNTIDLYIPWHLHEPQQGFYEFGSSGSDFEMFLNVTKFIKMAQEEDLFVIVRPGPYICAELDLGGLPSWVLRYTTKIRTSDPIFMKFVRRYFEVLFKVLVPLQFTNGGAIIAFQIENEYGQVWKPNEFFDISYLEELKQIFIDNGVKELLFMCGMPSREVMGFLKNVLSTANFMVNAELELGLLKRSQPGKPLMVSEYWAGWSDYWLQEHSVVTVYTVAEEMTKILKLNASVNVYMFHGGTSWGFLSGANLENSTMDNSGFMPQISSYDFNAVLTESGEYTEKYYVLRDLFQKYTKHKVIPHQVPKLTSTSACQPIKLTKVLPLNKLLEQNIYLPHQKIQPMELLDINNQSGQSFGYIVYRKTNITLPPNSLIQIKGYVTDTIIVMINGQIKSKVLENASNLHEFGFWYLKDSSLNLGNQSYPNATLDLLVENFGRNDFGFLNQQFKGLWHDQVLINNQTLEDWTIFPMEFKQKWTQNLVNWEPMQEITGPALYRANLILTHNITDTFLDLRGWKKGIIIVNGFVLSRYFMFGPQQTAYLPAPLLHIGINTIDIFEQYQIVEKTIRFSDVAIIELLL